MDKSPFCAAHQTAFLAGGNFSAEYVRVVRLVREPSSGGWSGSQGAVQGETSSCVLKYGGRSPHGFEHHFWPRAQGKDKLTSVSLGWSPYSNSHQCGKAVSPAC